MKLAIWNVDSLEVRLPRVLRFLARHEPGDFNVTPTGVDAHDPEASVGSPLPAELSEAA